MKKLCLFLLSICFFTACHNSIWDAIEDLDGRVATLEELCKEMNTNITSLQTIVSVLQSNDYITNVAEIRMDGIIIGYTISFGKHDSITIYHGQNGTNGADGNDGITPIIGVAKDTDGVYYWTLNGEWLLGDNGNKIPVSGKDGKDGANGADGKDGQDGKDGADGQDGVTPLLKIEDGYWYVSYDNGATWTLMGKAIGADGQNGQDGANGADGQDGVTPLLKIENGYWYISYDNGATWAQLGKATGEDGQDGQNGTNGTDGKDGQDGTNGTDGKDGVTPMLKIEDGYWYVSYDNGTTWTQFGKATGADGQNGTNGTNGTDGKDGQDGITPQLKIEEGYWYISYDNGVTWKELGKATGEDGKDGQNGTDGKDGQDGDSMFQSVTQDENYVYFTLADGTVIKVKKASIEDQPNSEFMFIVTYDANGGEGVMQPDTFYYGVLKALTSIKYTNALYRFVCWNTKADGTGISYSDGQQLMISKNITLYAQWGFHSYLVNGVSFTMVAVEGGTFTMGATAELESGASKDESPTHSVTLSDFYIGETEVTLELWKAVMDSHINNFPGTNVPVDSVSWNDCQTFIAKLNQLTGKNFRLPTEAEWEYAARGGNKSKGYKYAGSNDLNDVAWWGENSNLKTHPVKQKQPNELGLYDMTGNVWEWCQDWYGNYSSTAQTNPTGPTSGSDRVSRGGGWGTSEKRSRVSQRNPNTPTFTSFHMGLRLAL